MSALRTLFALALVALVLPACDSTEEFAIGGTYTGQTNVQEGLEATLTLVIPQTEDGGSFSFTGTTLQFDDLESFSGTGSYAHPTVTLTAEGETITGTVSADGDALTLDDDSGLGAFTLRRQ